MLLQVFELMGLIRCSFILFPQTVFIQVKVLHPSVMNYVDLTSGPHPLQIQPFTRLRQTLKDREESAEKGWRCPERLWRLWLGQGSQMLLPLHFLNGGKIHFSRCLKKSSICSCICKSTAVFTENGKWSLKQLKYLIVVSFRKMINEKNFNLWVFYAASLTAFTIQTRLTMPEQLSFTKLR